MKGSRSRSAGPYTPPWMSIQNTWHRSAGGALNWIWRRDQERLWDLIYQQRVLLEEAIAERSGQDQRWNAAAAHLTIMIITMAFDFERDTVRTTTSAAYADQIIAMLHGSDNPLPVRE